MPSIDIEKTRTLLQEFSFARLFVEILGWGLPRGLQAQNIQVSNVAISAKPISQLGGVAVFEVVCGEVDFPDSKLRREIHKSLSTLHHENLIIFIDANRSKSLWYWVKRQDKKQFPREHLFLKGQPGDLFLGKLNSMVVDVSELDSLGNINVLEIAGRLQSALDVEKVTKKFYTEFAEQRLEFVDLIEGLQNENERKWYASILLNRMMFIFFLQRKGFINKGDFDYLQEKLNVSRQTGKDKFYKEFLTVLFFEGFAKPKDKRAEGVKNLIGDVRYLNGGLFLPHPLEKDRQISIPDEAFENLLRLFSSYSWNLDDTPGGQDNEINPDVLGYIFEKYINQKSFGAYYTPPEITDYLCERTIHQVILQKLNVNKVEGIVKGYSFADVNELLTNLDPYLCKQLLFDVLPKLSILDPACGSGAFLVAAMKTLINIYGAIIGRIEFLNDKALTDWLAKTRAEHPSISYFIKKKIITDNLYGVDIMEEAAEIARLRLFLALVASVRKETDLEPLPNIDFNILKGNSLIGLLRIDEQEFNRRIAEAGGQRQASFVENYTQGKLFSTKTFQQIVDEKNRSIDTYRNASTYAEDLQALRDAIESRRTSDYVYLNEMMVDEFRELGVKYEEATWDHKKSIEGKRKKRSVQLDDIENLKPFHWGYDFDQVMNLRGGFDVIIANPPWDVLQSDEKEFFQEFEPTIKKKKIRIEDWRLQKEELLKDNELRTKWLAYLSSFGHITQYYRKQYHFQGKVNLYILFTERCLSLAKKDAFVGVVVPSGIYTDLGSQELRRVLFDQTQLSGVFSFENRKEIFEGVHRSFKFSLITLRKDGRTNDFPAAFMRHDLVELEAFPNLGSIRVPVKLVRKLSPDSLSVMEFKEKLDLQIAERVSEWPLLGEKIPSSWNLQLTQEFNMTTDSHLFKPTPGKGRLPLVEGKQFHQFDFGWGRPRYWLNESEARSILLKSRARSIESISKADNASLIYSASDISLDYESYRLAIRDVSASTNERTAISTVIPPKVFCPHTVSLEKVYFDQVDNGKILLNQTSLKDDSRLYVCALINSFVVDYLVRQRISSHLSFFYLYQLPIPRLVAGKKVFHDIVIRTAKLICVTSEFDQLARQVGLNGWQDGEKSPSARAKLRAELDAMVAKLYGLDEIEFAHVLDAFPIVDKEVKANAFEEFKKL